MMMKKIKMMNRKFKKKMGIQKPSSKHWRKPHVFNCPIIHMNRVQVNNSLPEPANNVIFRGTSFSQDRAT